MHAPTSRIARSSIWSIVALLGCAAVASAQGETLSAVASIKTAGGVSSTAPVNVVLSTLSSDADRDALVAEVKKGGTAAAQAWLARRPDIGSISVGARKTPIKYAYARSMGDGRLLTVATGEPIAFVGAGLPGAKPTAGFLLGVALLTVPGSGEGTGELSPAAKIRVDAQGAIVTEDFNPAELVQLSKIAKK